ncbi:unnamed protein product [Vicia faba]|uniref:Uncharacterized protein n=1 Tax=Vicia faba TaxID=3906 RepID=A0AAV0Z5D0_VICFA|nr:unnamed protein product [Vicia faba]
MNVKQSVKTTTVPTVTQPLRNLTLLATELPLRLSGGLENSRPATGSLSLTELSFPVNRPSILKHKFVDEVMVSDEERKTRVVRFRSNKANVLDSEEEKTTVKGQRSKRKRPSPFKEKNLFNDFEGVSTSSGGNINHENMDANWILMKLGSDAELKFIRHPIILGTRERLLTQLKAPQSYMLLMIMKI